MSGFTQVSNRTNVAQGHQGFGTTRSSALIA